METAMSQLLNTASLFQTSLRRWQAEFKAKRSGTDVSAAPEAGVRRLLGAPAAKRLGRRPRQAVAG